jgi:hypothetical protein
MHSIDLGRIALMLLAILETSEGGYMLLRYSTKPEGKTAGERNDNWRVNVRFAGMEHTSTAQVTSRGKSRTHAWQCLLLCLDRAQQWLRAATARAQLTRDEELRAWMGTEKTGS